MTTIIAEIGINHSGSVETAKALIDAAKWAGADYVKFQKRTVIQCIPKHERDKRKQTPWGEMSYFDYKLKIEFEKPEYDEIDAHCKKIGIPWFASAWDSDALIFLDQYNLPMNKIASALATHAHMIHYIGQRNKPVIASTAMCTMQQIADMVEILKGEVKRGVPITLMHCVGTYPADEKDLNLRMIHTLRKTFKLDVGYSGHETSVSPSVMAAVMGATIIERHITLDRASWGSDQAASLEPIGFKTMVDQIHKISEIMGDGVKRIIPGEAETAKKLRYWNAA